MNVIGLPQLYAYLIGWWQYDIWWSAMRETGVFYIPIAVIYIRCIVQPFLSQEARSGAVTAVKRLLLEMLYLIIFIMICALPAVFVNLHDVRFIKHNSNGSVTTYDYKNNDSTFSQHVPASLEAAEEVAIPLGWYLFLSLTNGLIGMGFDTLSDKNTPVRQQQQMLNSLGIHDLDLRKEYQQFLEDCYRPAYAKYNAGNYPDGDKSSIKQINKEYGQVNLNFAGSKVLTQYFYQDFRASRPVAGFPFNASTDSIYAQQKPQPKWGRPYCNTWWPTLRENLLDSLKSQWENQQLGNIDNPIPWSEMITKFKSWLPWSNYNSTDVDNAFLYYYLTELSPQRAQSAGLGAVQAQSYYSEQYSVKYAGDEGAEKASLLLTNLNGAVTVLLNMLPLIQMFMLAGTFSLLVFGVMMSMFSFRFIMTAFAFVFVLISCTYLWHLVTYIDNIFIQSLYVSPNTAGGKFGRLYTSLSGGFLSKSLNTNVVMVNIVAILMYIGFPSLAGAIMAWAGYSVGGALDSAMSGALKQSDRGNEAGKALQGVAGTVVKQGIGKAMK
jgi:hypothetical protein